MHLPAIIKDRKLQSATALQGIIQPGIQVDRIEIFGNAARALKRQTLFGLQGVARDVSGPAAVNDDMVPTMGGEDFSYMLQARPGAFIFIGNGDTAGLHHPAYNFNDDAIPTGMSYWVRLVESAAPAA